jgi:Holliday junction resolvase RusA-like endonuclease|nr:MAG TPA: Endodeoxyribonuclease RusA [Caudoviricetes sp.]
MIYDKQIIRGKIPSKSNCYKIVTLYGHGSLAKQKVLKEYEKTFYVQCGLRDKKIKGFFKINVDVYHENLRPDLDNAFKILLDCLQSCKAIENDRQCVEIHARKLVDKLNPRIEFVIEEVEL